MGVEGWSYRGRLLLEVVRRVAGNGEGGGVTLRDTGSEVREEAGPQGVGRVQALHDAQVAGNLRHAFPEAQRQEVQSQSLGVKITCSETEGAEPQVELNKDNTTSAHTAAKTKHTHRAPPTLAL